MKLSITLSSAATVVALAFSALSIEAAASVLFTFGFSAIALADYSRRARSLATARPVGAAAGRGTEKLGLAA